MPLRNHSGVERDLDQSIVVPLPMHRDVRRDERQGEDRIAVDVALFLMRSGLDPNPCVHARRADQLQSIDAAADHDARTDQAHERPTADP